MIYRNVKLGADPELFLIKGQKYVSAIGKIGGSKEEPKKIDDRGSAIQEDNVAVEFNIIPASTKVDFIQNVCMVLSHLEKVSTEMGLSLAPDASAFFEEEELKDPKARRFGCDPDLNIWELRLNEIPSMPRGYENLRTCGGHIHISWDDPEEKDRIHLGRSMDIFCGVPSLFTDKDHYRRMLYGRAGACRMKEYGIEYRVLSNFWLQSSQQMEWAFDQTHKAIEYLNNGGEIDENDYPVIFNAINNKDKKSAQKIMKKYNVN